MNTTLLQNASQSAVAVWTSSYIFSAATVDFLYSATPSIAQVSIDISIDGNNWHEVASNNKCENYQLVLSHLCHNSLRVRIVALVGATVSVNLLAGDLLQSAIPYGRVS